MSTLADIPGRKGMIVYYNDQACYYLGRCTRRDEGEVGYDVKLRPVRLGKGPYTFVGAPDAAEVREVSKKNSGRHTKRNSHASRVAPRRTVSDAKVIEAFTDKRLASGKKLSTDGVTLDGHWMGGTAIAMWVHGQIRFPDLGSKASQTIQKKIARMVPRNWIESDSLWALPRAKRTRNPAAGWWGHDESPKKKAAKKKAATLTRAEFDQRYWGAGIEGVAHSTRREFYSDYRESGQSFAAYKRSTSKPYPNPRNR
jgi:hypothetical protein